MNAEKPVQIDLFGVSATRTTDTRLAEITAGLCTPVATGAAHAEWYAFWDSKCVMAESVPAGNDAG